MHKACFTGIHQIAPHKCIISILGFWALVFFSSMDTLIQVFPATFLQPNDYHTNFVLNALRSNTLVPFVPILAVLPYAASYIDDIKSKFARFFLIRTEYVTYLKSRILVCFLSGGLVIVTGTLLAWGVSALLFLPMEKAAEAPSETTDLLLETCVLLFLNGGLWAVLGMTMSTVMESKYIAYCSPFIVYYLLVILYERYFPNVWLLYPKNWLNPEIWPYGIGGAALFLLELTFLCSSVFYVRGKRRLQQL